VVVYVLSILLILVALLQATIVPAIPYVDIRPDLVLLLVLAWTMVRGTTEGAVGALIGGLALDLFSPLPLGSHALIMLLIIVPIGWLGAPFYRGNLAFPIGGAFLATALYNVLLLLLATILGQDILWGGLLWRVVLPMALIEATLMPLAYWLLDRIDRRVHRRFTIA
jgi:rod shape-determining protein MreD